MANYVLRIGFSTASSYSLTQLQGTYFLTGQPVTLTYSGGAVSAITSSVLPSRTTGVAPFAVQFDATGTTSSDSSITNPANGGAFRNIKHAFTFGDPTSGVWSTTSLSRNTHNGGPITCHVFETPGTYTVNITHSHAGTLDKQATPISITVQDPNTIYAGTLTICINGTGTNDGLGPAGCAYAASIGAGTNGRRYLLKAGGSYTVPGNLSNCVFDRYGTGANPIIPGGINNTGSATNTVIWTNLDIRNFILTNAMHGLVWRCSVKDNTGSPNIQYGLPQSGGFLTTKYQFIGETTFDDATGTCVVALYGIGAWVSIMGCTTNRQTQHDIRLTNFYKCAIQHCILPGLATSAPGRHCIKAHSAGTTSTPIQWDEVSSGSNFYSQYLVISNNITGSVSMPIDVWLIATDPQNGDGSAIEGVVDVIVENNIQTLNPANIGVSFHHVAGGRRITNRTNTPTNATYAYATGVNSGGIPAGFNGPYFSS